LVDANDQQGSALGMAISVPSITGRT